MIIPVEESRLLWVVAFTWLHITTPTGTSRAAEGPVPNPNNCYISISKTVILFFFSVLSVNKALRQKALGGCATSAEARKGCSGNNLTVALGYFLRMDAGCV